MLKPKHYLEGECDVGSGETRVSVEEASIGYVWRPTARIWGPVSSSNTFRGTCHKTTGPVEKVAAFLRRFALTWKMHEPNTVEGTCKHMIGRRLKQTGAHCGIPCVNCTA